MKKIFIFLLIFVIAVSMTCCGTESSNSQESAMSSDDKISTAYIANVTFNQKAFVVCPDSFDISDSSDATALVEEFERLEYSTSICNCEPIAIVTFNGSDIYYLKGSITLDSFHAVCKYDDGIYLQADISDIAVNLLKKYMPVSSDENGNSLNVPMSATIYVNEYVGSAEAVNIYEISGAEVRKLYASVYDLKYSQEKVCNCMAQIIVTFENGETYTFVHHAQEKPLNQVRNTFGTLGQAEISDDTYQLLLNIIQNSTAVDWSPKFGEYAGESGVIILDKEKITYVTYTGIQYTGCYKIDANIMICYDPELDGEVYLRIEDNALVYLKYESSEIDGIDAEDEASFTCVEIGEK